MWTSFAADAVLVLHFAFILLVACGGLLVVWKPHFMWVHVPVLIWGVGITALHGICPLTPLENSLRARAGEVGYPGSFIEQYLMPVIYPLGLTAQDQDSLALVLVVLNGLLYGWALFRHRP